MQTFHSISFLKGRKSFSSELSRRLISAAFIFLLLPALSSSVLAQHGSAPSSNAQAKTDRIITYQAQIMKDGEVVRDGLYHITASIYYDADGKALLWRSIYATDVRGGIANLNLGELSPGANPLPEVGLDGPLYLGISVGSGNKDVGEELRPLTRISPSLNALSVADSSITSAKIAADYVSAVTVDGQRVTKRGGELRLEAGSGIKLTYDASSEALRLEIPPALTANGTGSASTTNGCSTNDDGGIGNNQVSGGCDNKIFSTDTATPFQFSTISGGEDNDITSLTDDDHNPGDEATWWHTIGGGHDNTIVADIVSGWPEEQYLMGASTIGGGDSNLNISPWGTISGGRKNAIAYSIPTRDIEQGRYLRYNVVAGGDSNRIMLRTLGSVIGGGSANFIAAPNGLDSIKFITIGGGDTNKITGTGGVIGGGHRNTILSQHDVISGGSGGSIGSNSDYSTISGGLSNDISDAENSTIGGGKSNTTKANNTTIGGGTLNRINPSSHFSTIAGGTLDSVLSQYSFVGGGNANTVGTGSDYATIGGGDKNKMKDAEYSVIAGGTSNSTVADHSSILGGESNSVGPISFYSTISGGFTNAINGSGYATIAGGALNLIDSLAPYSTIGGGHANRIQGRFSVISGGDSNQINHVEADHNFTGGGLYNVQNNPSLGVIGGGRYNLLDTNAWASSIVGGEYNTVRVSRSFLGGGSRNTIEKFDYLSALVGGEQNSIWAEHAFIGGGYQNFTQSAFGVLVGGSHDTVLSSHSFLGGGFNNTIDWSSDSAVLVGGSHNWINFGRNSFLGGGQSDSIFASWSFLGGGRNNVVGYSSPWSVLVGGDSNSVSDQLGFIGGGCHNSVSDGLWGTIVAGCSNTVRDSLSFIGGGSHNLIEQDFSVIGGGGGNTVAAKYASVLGGLANSIDNGASVGASVIGGGQFNRIIEGISTGILSGDFNTIGVASSGYIPHWSVIAGGDSNTILDKGATAAIVGGHNLIAQSYNQIVMGRNNKALGASVFGAPIGNDPLLIVGNGTGSATVQRSNAFEISNNGHSIVHHTNGSGTTGNSAFLGGTYVDNVILAWGEVTAGAGLVSDFGVFNVSAATGVGVYKIELNIADADLPTVQKLISKASITVTVVDDAEPSEEGSAACGYATTSKIRTTLPLPGNPPALHPYFYVRTYSGQQTATVNDGEVHLDCNPQAKPFMFKVTGRM